MKSLIDAAEMILELLATSTKKTLTLWHYVSTCPIFFKDLSLVERRYHDRGESQTKTPIANVGILSE
jgi:hypothetical protein